MNAKRKSKLTDLHLLIIWHFIGLILVSSFGAIAHGIARNYPSIIVKLLFPANLSTWEQGKLLIMPLSLFFFLEYFIIGKKFKNYIPVHFLIAYVLPIAMVLLYVLYRITIGVMSNDGPQILFALILLLAAFLFSISLLTSEKDMTKYYKIFILLYFSLCIVYIIFTFIPLRVPLFYDPINELYGPAY